MRKNLNKLEANRLINKNVLTTNILVFSFFCLFVFVSHWSLLIDENLMKWDIWQAEYPAQVLMSDALDNNTLPLWNPLFRYGTPFYSVLGTPIWYPFTLLLAWIGYTPFTIAFSYAMHVLFGGYGMYHFAKEHVKDVNGYISIYGFFASIIAGILYCGCGVFLSNAQHIMIVISAAWIPYVFLFARKYLTDKKIVYVMLAATAAGLILTGGYPEMFYNLFLLLVPYFLYFNYDKAQKKLKNVVSAAYKYILLCIMTILSAAVIVLPFLKNMGLITRGNGLGQIPNGYTFSTLFSLLFPQMTKFVTGLEISMVNYYMGLITVLLLPFVLFSRNKVKKLYFALILWAFCLCWGMNSPIHSLLYRFLPMYSSFRFPTLNRIFIVFFMLVLIAVEIRDLFEGEVSEIKYEKILRFDKILLSVVMTMAVLATLAFNLSRQVDNLDNEKLQYFSESAFVVCFFLIGYLVLFYLTKNKQISKILAQIVLVIIVGVEVVSYTYYETPITIAVYEPTAYSNTNGVKEHIEQEVKDLENREKSVEFSGNKRSTSGLNSKEVVFNKTFDEEGYLSFLLKSVADFQETYLRSIMEQNPVVYFTNNVVDAEDVNYYEWVNRCDTSPEQIYVENSKVNNNNIVQRVSPDVLSETELSFSVEENDILVTETLSATEYTTGRVRVYLGADAENDIMLEVVFVSENGEERSYQGNYHVYDGRENYVEVYYPDIDEQYVALKISGLPSNPISVKQVLVDRMSADQYVEVSSFGFNDIEMKVNAVADGYVTLLQTKHDGWTAYVDGVETDIETVDGCFMGIFLKEGEHIVTMKFRPIEFFIGVGITLLYWGALGCVIVYSMLKVKRMSKRTAYQQ